MTPTDPSLAPHPWRARVPNGLTLARAGAAPLLLAIGLAPGGPAETAALCLFALAALTDLADGALARAWRAESTFGARLDPLADKALVLAGLAVVIAEGTLAGSGLLAAALIAGREVFAAWRRLRDPVRFARPSRLAKLKTQAQMLALGALLAAPLWPALPLAPAGLACLWIAAGLSLLTLARYEARPARGEMP
ncbi:MAG: CDP-alcohol phosphatidyltransferase family protein [Alphaproteobacteria bacterium]|nr:CDP-alcohol phosphatidyltransferase family protein [Alphaproteobacteria bacterium]